MTLREKVARKIDPMAWEPVVGMMMRRDLSLQHADAAIAEVRRHIEEGGSWDE